MDNNNNSLAVNKPQYIVVDLREQLDFFNNMPSLYEVFRKFPLKDIITTMFTVSPYIDYSDIIFTEVEIRFEEGVDTELLSILFENIMTIIDEHIGKLLAYRNDFSYYLIDEWLGKTSVILKLE